MIKNTVNNKVYIGQSTNISRRWKDHCSFSFNENFDSDKNYHSHLYRSFRKYGLEKFSFSILEECNKSMLNDKELFYILKYESENHMLGYNKTSVINGAVRTTIWKKETFKKLMCMLEDFNYSIKEIADEFDVDVATIHYINRGDYLTDEKEEYPIRDKYEYNKFVREAREDLKRLCKSCDIEFIARYASQECIFCSLECKNYYNSKLKGLSKDELEKLIPFNSFEEIGRIFNTSGKSISNLCKKYGLPHKRSEIKVFYKEDIIKLRKEIIRNNCIRCGKLFYSKVNLFCSKKCLNEKSNKGRTVGLLPTREDILYKADLFNNMNDLSLSFSISYPRFKKHCIDLGLPTILKDLKKFNV